MLNKQTLSNIGPVLNGAVRLTGFLLLILTLMPVQAYYLKRKKDSYHVSLFLYRTLVRILGMKLRTHGILETSKPVLYVSNHTSYLDIPVLGALIPAPFVAKSEVAGWPFFGFLSKLQRTVFVIRQATRAAEQSDGLRELLQKGQSLILFPEGTSTVGLSVLPFKSSLFSIVQGDFPVLVQPVSVTCSGLDGMPMTRDLRPLYAWYGDMTLVPHLWNAFKMGRFTIDIVFHPPVSPKDFSDRKVLSAFCHQQVAKGVEQCLTGRGVTSIEASESVKRIAAKLAQSA